MGIAPYKYFTFDGESSRNYDVYLTGTGVFNAPQRAVDLLEIPGRNGNYALDQGRFNNITVTYKAGIVDYSESDFADKVSAVRNWLCSKVGYVRLTDDYNPDEYRMAVFKNGITVDHDDLKTGEFDITFECKPQRWLTSGETPIEIGAWHDVQTLSGDIVQFNALETDKVKSLVADIDPVQDLHGYDKPWVGGAGANRWDEEWELGGISNSGALVPANNQIRSKNFCDILPSTTYRLVNNSSYSFKIVEYDASKTGVDYWTVTPNNTRAITTNENTKYFKLSSSETGITTYGNNWAVNYPSTVTTYSPYSNICPISGHDEVDAHVTGFNQWDEEWENGYLGNSGGFIADANSVCSKNYIPIKKSATYYGVVPSGKTLRICAYNSSKTFISLQSIGNQTFTLPSNAEYIKFSVYNYGATYNNDISINYPSTDHDYHAYNGTTISVQFKDENDNVLTVYGGRDEIISGELTVTHGYKDINDFSTLTNWTSAGGLHIAEIAGTYTENAPSICSLLEQKTVNQAWSSTTECYAIESSKLRIYTTETTFANFETKFAQVQIVYELATPTTYTLTAQQVDLLVGQNNIFADTGDVTVEYGQNPMVLINPTPFEAEPLLAVKGYGTIDFNGYEVEIDNGALGTIQLANSNTMSTDTATISLSNVSSLNLGDTIYFSHDLIDSFVGIRAGNLNSVIDSSTLTSSSNVVATPKLIRNSRYDFSVKLVADMSARFVYGTSSTITSTATFSAECLDGTNITISASLTVVYDGDDTITVTRAVSVVGKTMIYLYPSMTIDEIYGDSTVNFLGDPTYIDCDLGECYKYESGEIVSLNGVIALGSDLPKLSSGANTFTMDGTVTELKVTPRWWKV